ncbi:MAG: hypothetical protein EBT75_00180 [Proteobacteria bacterium]|nr:hypothetical protein [Pseudomonadota bacterium]NBS49058.1 hypothetical protein [Verrucomicrobiota bacterium]
MADLGFIDDLWFDRGGGLDESMRLVDLIKASFGGDRSAAGRYAAEQRWKGHVKGGKSASVVMDESRLSWLTKPTDTSSEDFTKRIAERLVAKFSFVDLSAAVLVQLSMSYPKEGQQALRLLNAYKQELSGAKNAKEVGIIVNEIISRQGAQPRMYDSWETEELELIRLSGSIGDMQSDSLTQADRLVHALKQGWTAGSQKGRAQVAALTGQSLGASSNRNAEQDYERKDADDLTKIMNTDEGYAAKQVLTTLVKEVYDDTQRLIKEKLPEGTTHVRLFRGTALTEKQLRDAKDGLLNVAVTSSWTSSPKIAGDFRGSDKPKWDATFGRIKLEEVKITALVPVSSIFAVGLQGFGGQGEREVLVLGPSVEVQRVVPSTEAVGKDLAFLGKASFGGDRSAAGRYAAEQRWKGHVKKQPAAQSNPYNLQFSENLGAQLSLMGAAMRTVEDSGVDTQVFGRSDLTPDDIESMDDEIHAMRKRIEGAHTLNDFRLRRGKISDDEHLRTNELLGRASEAVRLGRMALTKMLRDPSDEDFEDELLVSRDADGKLVGLAMISTLREPLDMKIVYHNNGLKYVPLTVNGRSVYVEFLVSFQSVPQMGRALFGQVLKHSAGKGVQSIMLETTDYSRDYWQRIGFTPMQSYGVVSVDRHELNFPVDLMVGKMSEGD